MADEHPPLSTGPRLLRRRLTERPADGQFIMPPNGLCSTCGTRFSQSRRNGPTPGIPSVLRVPTSLGYQPFMRTGERCPECRMDLMGPGPEEQAEMGAIERK